MNIAQVQYGFGSTIDLLAIPVHGRNKIIYLMALANIIASQFCPSSNSPSPWSENTIFYRYEFFRKGGADGNAHTLT